MVKHSKLSKMPLFWFFNGGGLSVGLMILTLLTEAASTGSI